MTASHLEFSEQSVRVLLAYEILFYALVEAFLFVGMLG